MLALVTSGVVSVWISRPSIAVLRVREGLFDNGKRFEMKFVSGLVCIYI